MNPARRESVLLADFKRWGYDERGWLPGTRDRYAREVRAADRWLRGNRSKVIVQANLDDLKAFLFSKPPNARTRNRIRQALVAFGQWKVDAGVDDVNVALGLPRIREPELLPKPLTPKQGRALLAAAGVFGEMVECLILVLAYAGLRRSEVRTLEWRSVELERGEATFRVVGKRRKERVIPIEHLPLIQALRRWRAACDDPQWVFPSSRRRGQPVSDTWIRDTLYEIGDTAGIPRVLGPDGKMHGLHPHQLRHTFATTLSARGVPLEAIQDLMGHADPKTTRIYLAVASPRLREAIRALDYTAGPIAEEA